MEVAVLAPGRMDVEALGLGESITLITRELTHVRGNCVGHQRVEQCRLGQGVDRPGVLCLKYEGLGTGHAKRVEENKVIGRHLS